MKMNRSLLATALTAVSLGGVASDAMALNFASDFSTGTVEVKGTITAPVSANHWQWVTGDAIDFADSQITQMTDGFKKLTLAAAANTALLVGQTTAATLGNPSALINPQIAFKDGLNNVVTPVWDNSGNTGKGSITLPVMVGADTTASGTMTMKVKVGAIRAGLWNGQTFLQSGYSPATGTAIYGAAAVPGVTEGILEDGSTAATWNAGLGTVNAAALLAQVNTAASTAHTAWDIDNRGLLTKMNDPAEYYVGSYGLGISSGDSIVVDFTNPISTTTSWKAPLTVSITYN